jgi:hypothetical protein
MMMMMMKFLLVSKLSPTKTIQCDSDAGTCSYKGKQKGAGNGPKRPTITQL